MVIRLFGGIRVRPGMEDRERRLAEKLSSAVEAMPGFISQSTYPAAGGDEIGGWSYSIPVSRWTTGPTKENALLLRRQLQRSTSHSGLRTPRRTARLRGRTASTRMVI
jgi:hypothetical protein